MRNRIRQIRKQRGLTLATIAELLGTTPQTVSRLETEVMTLSTDWLQRIAAVLHVHPADLLESPDRPSIDLVASLGREGMGRIVEAECFDLDIPAERPVAVRLTQRCGPYDAGDVLIGNMLEGDNRGNAAGRDVLAALETGTVVLRRAIAGTGGCFTLVPLDPGSPIMYNAEPVWIASLVMKIHYMSNN